MTGDEDAVHHHEISPLTLRFLPGFPVSYFMLFLIRDEHKIMFE